MNDKFSAAAISLVLFVLLAMSSFAAERKTLDTHVAEVTSRLRPLEPMPATNRLRLDLGLPFRNKGALTNRLAQIYNPGSTNFHRYLSPGQFAEQFGPSQTDYEKVMNYAKSNGLSVVRTFGNRALVVVEGNAADIERTFQVHLGIYQHPTEARQFYGPDVEPSVDAALPIIYVSGMDNYVTPRRNGHRVALPKTPKLSGGSSSSGLYLGNDFRHAYLPGTQLNGSGQVIGLWEEDGYTPGDIIDYENTAQLAHVPVVNVLESSAPGNNNDEVASDIELAIAMAPGIKQVNVYEGSHTEIITAMATTNTAAEPLPNQLSCSWGVDGDTNIYQGLIELAMQGQSFLYAIGDSGAYANGVNGGTEEDLVYMTAVGGTQLFMTNSGAGWQSEIVWDGPPPTNFNYFASTGGVLSAVPIPDYQKGVSMALNKGSTQNRDVPDVALVARDIYIVFTQTPTNGPAVPGQSSGWVGTSAAAPLFSGIIALANQEAAAQGKPSIGFLNPAIYAIAESPSYTTDFHDITNGNNTWDDTLNGTSSDNLYYATNGYDLCTGWGTVASTSFLDNLVSLSGPVFVNFNYTGSIQNGQYATPFKTLAKGVSAVPSKGTIIIETAGSSSETMTISKPMTIDVNDGPATIGN